MIFTPCYALNYTSIAKCLTGHVICSCFSEQLCYSPFW